MTERAATILEVVIRRRTGIEEHADQRDVLLLDRIDEGRGGVGLAVVERPGDAFGRDLLDERSIVLGVRVRDRNGGRAGLDLAREENVDQLVAARALLEIERRAERIAGDTGLLRDEETGEAEAALVIREDAGADRGAERRPLALAEIRIRARSDELVHDVASIVGRRGRRADRIEERR